MRTYKHNTKQPSKNEENIFSYASYERHYNTINKIYYEIRVLLQTFYFGGGRERVMVFHLVISVAADTFLFVRFDNFCVYIFFGGTCNYSGLKYRITYPVQSVTKCVRVCIFFNIFFSGFVEIIETEIADDHTHSYIHQHTYSFSHHDSC